MKIVSRQPKATADISSARGSAGNELWKLVLSAVLLLVALYFILGWTVDFAVGRISFEMEARIFSDYQPPADANDEGEHEAYLKRAESILSKLTQSDSVPPLPYRLVVIDNEAPNAFAFPGGTIGVTTGLLDVLNEEIEVAFVLGHELGHFKHRDHLQGMGRAIGFGIVLYTVFGSSPGADSLGSMIDFALQRDYSQDRELRADRFGVSLVHATYGKVEGVDRLFRILLEKGTLPGWAYMFSTHPAPAKRVEDLKRFARGLRQ